MKIIYIINIENIIHKNKILPFKSLFHFNSFVREVALRETWRVGLLKVLLRERSVLERDERDIKRVTSMISSLCFT